MFEKIKGLVNRRIKSYLWFLNNGNDSYVTNTNIFENHVIRTIINAVARQASKLEVQHRDDNGIVRKSNVTKILGRRPNALMSPAVFFHAIVVQLIENSNAFIYLPFNKYGEVTEAKLIEYDQCKFYKWNNRILISVQFKSQITVYNYEDIVHLRICYKGGVAGKSITPDIQELVDLVHVSNEKLSKSVRRSGELNAYVKSEINLSDDKKDDIRNDFVTNLINDGSGIAVMDGKTELKEVNIKYSYLTEKQLKTIKQNLYNYFGIPEEIIKGGFSEEQFSAFLEMIIEPIVMQMQQEFSYKWFTEDELDAGNTIIFKTNRLRMASLANKGSYIETMTDKGIMSINDAREFADMERLQDENADVPRVPLDHASLDIANEYQILKAAEKGRENKNDNGISLKLIKPNSNNLKKEGERKNMKKMLLKLEIKDEISDEKIAIIEGIANRANVVDQGGDLTNKDTFVDTVKERPKVPLLASHNWDKCIGINELAIDSDGSLKTTIQINLDTQEGREQYSLVKQFKEQDIPYGLSIGYRTIKERQDDNGINILEAVDVREVSLTPFPMNQESTITAVKKETDIEKIRKNRIKKLLIGA